MNILIVFETQNGSTQYVSEVIQKQFQDLGHQVTLHGVKAQGMSPVLDGYDLLLFGAPTYEDGKLENSMRVFVARNNPDFSQKKVAVFGLGNSFYPQFCTSAQILADWVKKNKGNLLVEPLKIDGFPDNLQPIQAWIEQLSQKLV